MIQFVLRSKHTPARWQGDCKWLTPWRKTQTFPRCYLLAKCHTYSRYVKKIYILFSKAFFTCRVSYILTVREKNTFLFTPSNKIYLLLHHFSSAHNYAIKFYWHLLYRISLKLFKKYGIFGWRSNYASK